MQQAGHEVTMLTSSAQLQPHEIPAGCGIIRRGIIDGIACIVVDVPYHQTMGYARRIRSFFEFIFWVSRLILSEPRAELIYATSTPLTIAIPALIGRWVRRIPYIFEVRDLWPDVPFEMGILRSKLLYRLLKILERTAYRHAVATVGVNDGVVRQMRQEGRWGQTVLCAPNACDTNFFSPDRNGSWFRRQYEIGDAVLVVYTGMLGLANGLDVLMDAAGLLSNVPNLKIAIIGDGKEKPALKARAQRENLSHVLIIDGVPKQQLADVLATADIGVVSFAPVPILELNSANKYADYLAAGLPVVLNYQGWQAGILQKYDAGLSAPMGDTAAFAAAIRRLAADADERKRMGRNARKVAEGPLSRERVVQPILNVLAAMQQ